MEGKIENPGTVAVVLSGGNIDPMLMLKVIQRGLSAAGRYMTVRMMLDDRPGSLATIARIIAENDANVTGLDHTRVGGSISMGDVSITVNLETKGHEHCEPGPGGAPRRGFPADRGALGAMVMDAFGGGEPQEGETPRRGARRGLLVVGSFVVLLYLIEIVNTALFHSLNRTFGLRPRSLDGILDILTFPLLHANLAHLMSNTLPLIIFGFLVFLSGLRVFITALASSWLAPGSWCG